MKHFLEFGVFLSIATASHFVLFEGSETGAAEAMGNEGTQILTLAASSESLSAMVEVWERPVDAVQQVAMPQQQMPVSPPLPTVRPSQPPIPMKPAPAQSFHAPALEAPDLPAIDTANPPQPGFATAQSARPKERPNAPSLTAAKSVAQKQSASSKRQVAAGAGNGKAAGKKKEAKAPTKRQSSSPAAMAQWGGGIRSAVERRKKYPSNTRAQGRVVLAVAVSSTGKLSSVRIKRSSGNTALDNAAVSAVKRARFKAAPKGINSGVHHFSLPIFFSR